MRLRVAYVPAPKRRESAASPAAAAKMLRKRGLRMADSTERATTGAKRTMRRPSPKRSHTAAT